MEQNPKLSIREAARIYSVDGMTLIRRQHCQPSRRDSAAKARKLTDLQGSIIVQHILDLDSRSFPRRISDVEDMANNSLDARGVMRVGKCWIPRIY
jgi:hypothetical protein